MYGELGFVKGIVDLTPQQALDEAEVFLASLDYTVLQRTATTLTVERRSPDHPGGQAAPNLTIAVVPQPQGGVQIKIRGNDREGMQARQSEWMGWSESLPKKTEMGSDAPNAEQGGVETPEVELPPPPTVESPNLPAPPPAASVPVPPPQPPPTVTVPSPPRQGSTVWRGTKLAFGGCVVLPILLVIGFVGCLAIGGGFGGGGGGGAGSGSGGQRAQEPTVGIGQPVRVGEVSWTVTNARQASEISQRGFGQFGDKKQGNFVIVDFSFTNNSSEAVTLDSASVALMDSSGNKSEADPDTFGYVPANKDIFLENVNPGVTRQGQVIFTVAPGASGFELQVGDTDMLSDKNGYVDLGF
jgi:hypothetical protein